MAMITASRLSALDGVVDPMLGNWPFPYFNQEMGDAVPTRRPDRTRTPSKPWRRSGHDAAERRARLGDRRAR